MSKLVAVGGFFANAIASSDFIRKSVTVQQMFLPKTEQQLMNLIHYKYNYVKETTIK